MNLCSENCELGEMKDMTGGIQDSGIQSRTGDCFEGLLEHEGMPPKREWDRRMIRNENQWKRCVARRRN